MTTEQPHPDRCGAKCRDGGYCENYPVEGADRCRMHGADAGAPEGNLNASSHLGHADPANVLDHLAETDAEAYEWVLPKYDSYLDDAPFGAGSAKADQLKQIAAQEYIIWKATGFQLKGGVVRRTDGGDIAESPVNLPLDRMQRTVTRRLKELGVLDGPDSQQAAAEAGKVAALREMMNAVDDAAGAERLGVEHD